MKVTLLCENTASDVGYLSEWGFSAFIQVGGKNILFDTGQSQVYWHNAEYKGIDLDSTDYIVFSHFHSDHTNGLQFHKFRSRKKLIMHPEVLEKLPTDQAENILEGFEVVSSKSPIEFLPNVFYLGEIPRCNDFEKGDFDGDQMLDDSALAIATDKGVIVISGCAHAGICNICEYAQKVTQQKLYAVVGGFHLFEDNPVTIEKSIEYFSKNKPSHLLPMHCVDFPTLAKFHSIFGCRKYSAGDTIHL